jgi:hypothetical protein
MGYIPILIVGCTCVFLILQSGLDAIMGHLDQPQWNTLGYIKEESQERNTHCEDGIPAATS